MWLPCVAVLRPRLEVEIQWLTWMLFRGSREQNYRPEDCGICHAALTERKDVDSGKVERGQEIRRG